MATQAALGLSSDKSLKSCLKSRKKWSQESIELTVLVALPSNQTQKAKHRALAASLIMGGDSVSLQYSHCNLTIRKMRKIAQMMRRTISSKQRISKGRWKCQRTLSTSDSKSIRSTTALREQTHRLARTTLTPKRLCHLTLTQDSWLPRSSQNKARKTSRNPFHSTRAWANSRRRSLRSLLTSWLTKSLRQMIFRHF